jgi:hypothetical protein
MKRSYLVILGLGAMVALSLSFTKHEDPIFKNLKVLPKNITKEQMDSVMHHFSLSLGVRCNFCHMRNEDTNTWDFASDASKHKLAARGMMEMMQKLNDKYFAVTDTRKLDAKLLVTCYTCHHGANEPATIPPMPVHMERPSRDSSNHAQPDSTRHNQ